MGQLFSSFFRFLGVEVKRDGADSRSLISDTQGLSHGIAIVIYPNNYMELRQSFSPTIIFRSTYTHRLLRDAVASLDDTRLVDFPSYESCMDPETDHSDQHSSVADNSSMSRLDQGTETTIYAEEIKGVLSEREPAGQAKQVCGIEAESMTKAAVVSSADITGAISKETKLDVRRIEPYTSLARGRCCWLVKGSSPILPLPEEASSSTINMAAPSRNSQAPFRKAADYNFSNIVNQFPPPPSPRPSTTAMTSTTVRSRSSGDYNRYQRILVVGDGDFSFSASLALAFGSASNMVSTSLDSYEFLAKNYKRSMNNIAELKARGCKVLHGVDATEMANHPQLRHMKYDRIIFNFPLAGFFPRDVPRQLQIQKNRALVAGFMANAKRMIEANGEIHIRHKSYGFYKQWNLEQLGRSEGLLLKEEVDFQLSDYPGYHTKYGFGGDNDFDCCNSKTYRFSVHPFDFRQGIPMQSVLWD